MDLQIKEVDGRGIFDIIHEYAPEIPVVVQSVLPLKEQKNIIAAKRIDVLTIDIFIVLTALLDSSLHHNQYWWLN